LPRLHEAILAEILEERVPWRPWRQYPRVVKRQRGAYPMRNPATPKGRSKTTLYQVVLTHSGEG
jgi:hypothetical protein